MIYDFLHNITFGQPWFFLLFLIFPVLIFSHYFRKNRKEAAMRVSSVKALERSGTFTNIFQNIPFWLRLLALSAMILALARPQVRYSETYREGEGIDIILCIDVSGSMTAEDFSHNRMEAAKKVAIDFVNHRPDDKIGVVIFAGESFTQCPLTTDHYVLISQIQQIRNGLLEDGTSIGSGLATSVDRLRNSKAKSKVVILLTDGVNNSGLIDPSTAKEIAKAFHVKVYTIGVGTDQAGAATLESREGTGTQQPKVTIDEKMLKNIADETGGKYFRATDNRSLGMIYSDIDKMEKSKMQVTTFHRYSEKFYPLVMLAIALLIIEALLRYLVFKKFP